MKKILLMVMAVCAAAVVALGVMMILEADVSGGYGRNAALIKMLDEGCRTYRVDFGVFPPGDPDFDSRTLYRCLGTPRGKKPPIIEFIPGAADRSGRILDSWSRPIKYANPGRWNPRGIDIWSSGKNGRDELDPKREDFDDLTNWNKEY